MAITAAIKFTQGATVGDAGFALIGVTGASVTVANGNNSTVARWVFTILDVPPGSAVPLGVVSDGPSSTAAFTPDVVGSYRIQLDVYTALNILHAVDTRSFIVPNSRGWMYPAFRQTAAEFNFKDGSHPAGNARGWTTALEQILKDLETAGSDPVYICSASTPSATAGHCVALTNTGKVTLANTASLTAAFAVFGVAKQAIAPNLPINVVIDGSISPTLGGLVSSGPVRCNPTTGALEVVSQFASTDYPVGGSNGGWVSMARMVNNAFQPFVYGSLGGLVADYDPNTLANGTLASWTDFSGSGNHAVQATGANQPSVIAAAINGRKTVRGNGTTSFMRCASFLLNSNEMTVFIVGNLAVAGTTSVMLGYNISTVLMNHAGTSGNPSLTRGSGVVTYNSNVAATGYAIRSGSCSSAGANEFFYKGISRGTVTDTTAIPPTGAPLDLFAINNGGGFFAQSDIARILIYNKVLSPADTTRVYNQLALDYAL